MCNATAVREPRIRKAPAAFKVLRSGINTFDVTLMPCTASVLRSPLEGMHCSFRSQHDSAGHVGTDVFAQDYFHGAEFRISGLRVLFSTP